MAARVAVARLDLMGRAVIVRLRVLLSAVTVALAEMVLAALGRLALQLALLVLAAREQSLTQRTAPAAAQVAHSTVVEEDRIRPGLAVLTAARLVRRSLAAAIRQRLGLALRG